MIRPPWASNPDSPITVARQRVPRRYQLRHRGRLIPIKMTVISPKFKIVHALHFQDNVLVIVSEEWVKRAKNLDAKYIACERAFVYYGSSIFY